MQKPTIEDVIQQVKTGGNISIEIGEEGTTINEIKEGVEITLNGHKVSFGELPDDISDDFLEEKLKQLSVFLDFLTNQLKEQQSETHRSITTEMDIDRGLSTVDKGTAKMLKTISKNVAKVIMLLSFKSPNNVNDNMLNEVMKYKSTERLKSEIDKLKVSIKEKLGEKTSQLTDDLFSAIDDCLITLQRLLETQKNYINSQKTILYE